MKYVNVSRTIRREVSPWTQDANEMYVRCSGDVLDIVWTSHVPAIYALREFVIKVFFKMLQNFKESSLWSLSTMCVSVNLAKFLRAPTSQNISGQLFLCFIRIFSFSLFQKIEKVFFLQNLIKH